MLVFFFVTVFFVYIRIPVCDVVLKLASVCDSPISVCPALMVPVAVIVPVCMQFPVTQQLLDENQQVLQLL